MLHLKPPLTCLVSAWFEREREEIKSEKTLLVEIAFRTCQFQPTAEHECQIPRRTETRADGVHPESLNLVTQNASLIQL